MSNALLIIVLIIVFIAGFIFIPQLMIKRAVKQVVAILRKHGATSAKMAKFADEMGIKPQGMFTLNMGLRDYKYHALQALLKHEIVQLTEEGKVYLVEEKTYLLKI